MEQTSKLSEKLNQKYKGKLWRNGYFTYIIVRIELVPDIPDMIKIYYSYHGKVKSNFILPLSDNIIEEMKTIYGIDSFIWEDATHFNTARFNEQVTPNTTDLEQAPDSYDNIKKKLQTLKKFYHLKRRDFNPTDIQISSVEDAYNKLAANLYTHLKDIALQTFREHKAEGLKSMYEELRTYVESDKELRMATAPPFMDFTDFVHTLITKSKPADNQFDKIISYLQLKYIDKEMKIKVKEHDDKEATIRIHTIGKAGNIVRLVYQIIDFPKSPYTNVGSLGDKIEDYFERYYAFDLVASAKLYRR